MESVQADLDLHGTDALELEKVVVIAPGTGWKIELTPSHAWNGEATVSSMAQR